MINKWMRWYNEERPHQALQYWSTQQHPRRQQA
ncbi:MAG: transposase [Nitrospirales bacterium]|nr:integrase core domain-containing protein [Nitrospira sp.]MDR4461031.1 transposase [Nitrospirales bacterium]MDR4484490.1 transposase [Nitrospirales bacterium]